MDLTNLTNTINWLYQLLYYLAYSSMPVLIPAAVVLAILAIVNFSFRDALRDFIYRNPLMSVLAKVFAIVATFLLAYSDFYAVSNIFVTLGNGRPSESRVFCITFAAFLEGFAFLFGIALARLTDRTNHRSSDKRVNRIGFFMTLVPLIVSWMLAVYLRFNQLTLELSLEQKQDLNYVLSYIPGNQIFLLFSPILTSILALGISWFAFPSCSLLRQERSTRYLQNRYLRYRNRYENIQKQYQDARIALWRDIADIDSDQEPLANTPALFRECCLTRLRQKVVSNALDQYETLVQAYNLKFESELFTYISQLADRSTLPHRISSITVQEILELYQEQTGEDWASRNADNAEVNRLRRNLENTTRQAQFRTTFFKKW